MIAFFEWPDVKPGKEKDHGAPVTGPYTFDHVAIGVDSDDDLWDLKNRLEGASVWVSEVVNHGFIHSLYSFDPNNIAIEFCAPVKGFDIRKTPIMEDSNPSDIALQGAEVQPGVWQSQGVVTPKSERSIYQGMGSELAEGVEEQG